MIITILAFLVGLIAALGGIAPNVANGMAQDRLNEALNQPEYLSVQTHPHAPSFSLLGSAVKYTEIDARRFVISDLPVESLQVRLDALSLSTDQNGTQLNDPSQGMVRVRLTEAGINKFLKSDTFRRLLDELRQQKEILSQLDAEIDSLAVELQADRILVSGQASTLGGFFTIPFELSGQLRLATERQLKVQNVQATTLGRPLAPDMILAILENLNPILDLSKLDNQDLQFYFRELQVRENEIELVGEARIKNLPAL